MKNYALEWYRYLFMSFICILHIKEYYGTPYPFGGAYLAVEFFLIVSGFLLMKVIDEKWLPLYSTAGEQELVKGMWRFAWYKYIRFYPHYLFSYIMLAIYCIVVRHVTNLRELIVYYWPEGVMLMQLGIGKHLNAAMWYVSALFLCSIIIFYLAMKNRNKFIYMIAPTFIILIYTWVYQTFGALGGVGWGTSFLVNDGVFRAMAGLCVGCVVYEISSMLEKHSDSWPLLRSVEEIGILIVIGYRFYHPGNTPMDFVMVGLMALFVLSVVTSGQNGGSYLTQALKSIHIDGRYVYAIYLNHWMIQYAIRDFLPGLPFYPMLLGYLAVTVIFSIITTILLERITRTFQDCLPHGFKKGAGVQK